MFVQHIVLCITQVIKLLVIMSLNVHQIVYNIHLSLKLYYKVKTFFIILFYKEWQKNKII